MLTPQEIESVVEIVEVVEPYIAKAIEKGFELVEKKYPGIGQNLSNVLSVITAIQQVGAVKL
jgi:hypothetical protein